MTFSRTLILTLLVVTPSTLFAQQKLGTLVEFADTLANGVVTSVGYLMFTLAIVGFLWGMVQFIWAARQGDGGKGVKEGKQFMLWGLIALFVMFSVWGIITWAQSILNLSGKTTIVIPSVQLLPASSGVKPGSTDAPPICTAPNLFIHNGKCINQSCLNNIAGAPCDYSGSGTKDGVCSASQQCVPNTSRSSGSQPSLTTLCIAKDRDQKVFGTITKDGVCTPSSAYRGNFCYIPDSNKPGGIGRVKEGEANADLTCKK